ncbi:SDR family oxidoreductase [Ginsengibacter hankyongi]|uniref:SDR family oxidoreductase n=1 Tax=Ginsengibacter hankyongi TaxID=2607284 RepID=A0A5J5IJ50_9BACT|nr:SDR family oxidoreductase [Ginsengibacter hankyongi]KAA9039558.1 SDR family oxidoreductase [Ginsengibacter hankyongi]
MNIVITGGSKGIGKALAAKYADNGNNVFICARNEKDLADAAFEINKKNKNELVKYMVADISLKSSADKFAGWLQETNVVPDILINNAGQFIPGSIYNELEGLLEKMIAANLYSAYYITRALLPPMMKRKSGHLFNMCSIASLSAYHNGGSYSISKYALMGFSKNLREELKPYDIKVTAVYPGAVYTSSWADSGVDPKRIMEIGDITEMIYAASMLSPQACVEDIVIRPLQGDLP